MKRTMLLLGAVLLFAVFAADDAYAICQKCNNDNTPTAMCYTIVNPCEYGQATMGACVEKDGQNGNKYCDPVNSSPGPECSQPQPGCGSSGANCTITFGEICPAGCFSCTYTWGGGWGPWDWWWIYLY